MEPEQTWAGVEKIIEHPEYNGDVLNDIAVLRLAQEVANPKRSTFSISKNQQSSKFSNSTNHHLLKVDLSLFSPVCLPLPSGIIIIIIVIRII